MVRSGPSRIIEQDGIPVGVLQVEDRGDHLYLARIEVLPRWQGQGIGTSIVTDLTSRAPVELHVMRGNLRARLLYERLGFAAGDEGAVRIPMRHPGHAE